jgi:hypothetical protein
MDDFDRSVAVLVGGSHGMAAFTPPASRTPKGQKKWPNVKSL